MAIGNPGFPGIPLEFHRFLGAFCLCSFFMLRFALSRAQCAKADAEGSLSTATRVSGPRWEDSCWEIPL